MISSFYRSNTVKGTNPFVIPSRHFDDSQPQIQQLNRQISKIKYDFRFIVEQMRLDSVTLKGKARTHRLRIVKAQGTLSKPQTAEKTVYSSTTRPRKLLNTKNKLKTVRQKEENNLILVAGKKTSFKVCQERVILAPISLEQGSQK